MSSSVPCVFLVTAEALKSIDLVESHKARQDLFTQEKRCKGYINNYTPPTIFSTFLKYFITGLHIAKRWKALKPQH